MAMDTVAFAKRATVWATSPHPMPPLVRLVGLNSAIIHRKNRAATIPRVMGRTDGASVNVRKHRWAYRGISIRQNIQQKPSSPKCIAKVGSVERWDYWTRAPTWLRCVQLNWGKGLRRRDPKRGERPKSGGELSGLVVYKYVREDQLKAMLGTWLSDEQKGTDVCARRRLQGPRGTPTLGKSHRSQ